jgi:hypothetical protein
LVRHHDSRPEEGEIPMIDTPTAVNPALDL